MRRACTAGVHARCLDTGRESGFGADDHVVLASVVKVPLVLEFARRVAAGRLEPTDRGALPSLCPVWTVLLILSRCLPPHGRVAAVGMTMIAIARLRRV